MIATQHLASPAMLCEQSHRTYWDVLKTLAARGVEPVLTLDLTPYFDWHQASRALELPALSEATRQRINQSLNDLLDGPEGAA